MTNKALIQKTEAFVKKALSKEGTGHDWWHIVRVRNNAKAIGKKEKADMFVVDLALLLHDVGDRKVLGTQEDDYSIAENFLKQHTCPPAVLEEVLFIIKNMSFSKTLNSRRKDVSKEFQIVQDADRLDAVGAIGIARAFSFGGSRSRLIYDPSKKVQSIKTAKHYKKMQSSTLHHFYEKLFLLKELMNTATAKRIAERRNRYMQDYVQEFLAEWEGKR